MVCRENHAPVFSSSVGRARSEAVSNRPKNVYICLKQGALGGVGRSQKTNRMKYGTLPLYVKILAGMVLGILLGVVAIQGGFVDGINRWVRPFGEIFMRLLKFIAIPLVMVSLVKGVGSLSDIASLSRIGLRTIGIYVCTTVLAVVVGLALVEAIGPGRMVGPESVAALQAGAQGTATGAIAQRSAQTAQAVADTPPLQFLVDLFPENLVGAMANNGGMLQIIVIAVLVGVAVLLVGREKTEPFMRWIDSLDAVVLKLIDIVMRYAPIGVLALMAGMMADTAGNFDLLGALGMYVLTVVVGLLAMIFVFYPLLLHFFAKVPVRKFLKTMSPVQLLAFTTSSSAATLPLNMETVERRAADGHDRQHGRNEPLSGRGGGFYRAGAGGRPLGGAAADDRGDDHPLVDRDARGTGRSGRYPDDGPLVGGAAGRGAGADPGTRPAARHASDGGQRHGRCDGGFHRRCPHRAGVEERTRSRSGMKKVVSLGRRE